MMRGERCFCSSEKPSKKSIYNLPAITSRLRKLFQITSVWGDGDLARLPLGITPPIPVGLNSPEQRVDGAEQPASPHEGLPKFIWVPPGSAPSSEHSCGWLTPPSPVNPNLCSSCSPAGMEERSPCRINGEKMGPFQ